MNADRLMRNMMQSMGMGFGGGLFNDFMVPHSGHLQNTSPGHPMAGADPFSAMMPHGFMSPMSMMMMDPFQSMQQSMSMVNNGSHNGGFSYCSSSVTTYTTDDQGRPQVYQRSNEVKQGPDGLKETKEAVRDSRTGHQELAIGHHLREKAHIKKKTKNAYTGEEEQVDDLVNLGEEEAETFEQTWMQKARDASSFNQLGYAGGPTRNRLALTSGSSRGDDCAHYPSTSNRNSSNLTSKLFKKDKKKKKSKEERHK